MTLLNTLFITALYLLIQDLSFTSHRPSFPMCGISQRSDVVPTLLRLRANVAPMAVRRRADVVPMSGQFRADVGPMCSISLLGHRSVAPPPCYDALAGTLVRMMLQYIMANFACSIRNVLRLLSAKPSASHC